MKQILSTLILAASIVTAFSQATVMNDTNTLRILKPTPAPFWSSNRLDILTGLGLDLSINGGTPNGSGAGLHWSQLLGVPAGFADGTDDGGGGGGLITAVSADHQVSGGTLSITNTTGTGALVRASALSPYLLSATASVTYQLADPDLDALATNNGSALTNLSGSAIASGTVADARIAASIARLASPALTGTPTAPTAAPGTSNTTVATTAFVSAAVAAGGGGGGEGESNFIASVTADFDVLARQLSLTNATGAGALVRASVLDSYLTSAAGASLFQPLDPGLTALAQGDGGALTNLPASALTGTVPDERLSAAIVRTNNAFTITVPTASPGTSNTVAASTEYVDRAVAAGGSGGAEVSDGWDEWDEWLVTDWHFVGNAGSSTLEPNLVFAAVSGGVNTAPARPTGSTGIRTASGAAVNTGGFIHSGSGSMYMLSNTVWQWRVIGSVLQTNGNLARLGFSDSTATVEPVDALMFAVTNQVAWPVALSNSVKSVASSGFTLQQGVVYGFDIRQTNDFAAFQIYSNSIGAPSVLVYSDSISGGLPLGSSRALGLLIGGYNGDTSNTNSTDILNFERMRLRQSN